MRKVYIVVLLFGTLGIAPASAEGDRFCLRGFNAGYPGDCSFGSFAECKASASGTVQECAPNPRYAYSQPQRGDASRPTRRR
jgi:Protein of unknown function (DUF3551)